MTDPHTTHRTAPIQPKPAPGGRRGGVLRRLGRSIAYDALLAPVAVQTMVDALRRDQRKAAGRWQRLATFLDPTAGGRTSAQAEADAEAGDRGFDGVEPRAKPAGEMGQAFRGAGSGVRGGGRAEAVDEGLRTGAVGDAPAVVEGRAGAVDVHGGLGGRAAADVRGGVGERAEAADVRGRAGERAEAAKAWGGRGWVVGVGVLSLGVGVLSWFLVGLAVVSVVRGPFWGFVERGPVEAGTWGGPSRAGAWGVHAGLAVPLLVAFLVVLKGISGLHVRLARPLYGVRSGRWVLPATVVVAAGGVLLFWSWLQQL